MAQECERMFQIMAFVKTEVRENALHKPTIRTSDLRSESFCNYFARAICTVCNEPLGEGFSMRSEEEAIADLMGQFMNYCPHCGARLR